MVLLVLFLVMAGAFDCDLTVDGECAAAASDDRVVMTQPLGELPEYHLMMLQDTPRNEAYRKAISKLAKGRKVFDIGSGTGLLAMMASQFGAASVTTTERHSLMATIGHDCLELNGWKRLAVSPFTDFVKPGFAPIRFLNKESSSVSLNEFELKEPANLLVSEILDTFLVGEGVFSSILDAKRRNLITPDAIIMPSRANVFIQPVFCNFGFGVSNMVSGFNLKPIRPYRPAKHMGYGVGSSSPSTVALSEEQMVVSFDFNASLDSIPVFSQAEFVMNQTSVFNALLLWWDAFLTDSDEFVVSNRPFRPQSSWAQGLMMLMDDVLVEKGEKIRVSVGNSLTGWAFSARSLTKPGPPIHLQRVVILYESQCRELVKVVWNGSVIASLQFLDRSLGYTYPTTLLLAEFANGTKASEFVVSSDLETNNRFTIRC
jgi:hypothetical protein